MSRKGTKAYGAYFWLILALGVAVRIWLFGRVPGDVNQDEAFAGYEAWSLLHYGMDSAGYAWPVYLSAWGSGMNALESYLMLPFLALFGLRVWVIRLPQLLVGIMSIPALYGLLRRCADRETALWGALLLAICPWHVLLSRWGLESNLAPGFLLFGTYFFVRAFEDGRFLLLSALFYALSLYAYAVVWPVVPLLLLWQGIYCLWRGRLRADRNLPLSLLLLALLALPLLLFVAVNLGWMEEMRSAYFSVPRLLYLRAGEWSLRELPAHLKQLFTILWTQSDGLSWNSAGPYGLLYPLSLPFLLLGLVVCIAKLRGARGEFCPAALLLIHLGCALLPGLLIDPNVNRVNMLFLPLIVLTAVGIRWFCAQFRRVLAPLLLAAYLLLFGCFSVYYFTDYRERIGYSFSCGLEESLNAAMAREGTIVLSRDVLYPKVLFYSAEPVAEFRQTVVYRRYPAAYLECERFGRFLFGIEEGHEGESYILSPWEDKAPFTAGGYTMEQYGYYTLAYR